LGADLPGRRREDAPAGAHIPTPANKNNTAAAPTQRPVRSALEERVAVLRTAAERCRVSFRRNKTGREKLTRTRTCQAHPAELPARRLGDVVREMVAEKPRLGAFTRGLGVTMVRSIPVNMVSARARPCERVVTAREQVGTGSVGSGSEVCAGFSALLLSRKAGAPEDSGPDASHWSRFAKPSGLEKSHQ
jgi:hypothetical protein